MVRRKRHWISHQASSRHHRTGVSGTHRARRSVWAASSAGPDRRIYELTRAGMEELYGSAKAVAKARETLGVFLSRYEELVSLEGEPARAVPRR